jgi:hypothetical protein
LTVTGLSLGPIRTQDHPVSLLLASTAYRFTARVDELGRSSSRFATTSCVRFQRRAVLRGCIGLSRSCGKPHNGKKGDGGDNCENGQFYFHGSFSFFGFRGML